MKINRKFKSKKFKLKKMTKQRMSRKDVIRAVIQIKKNSKSKLKSLISEKIKKSELIVIKKSKNIMNTMM